MDCQKSLKEKQMRLYNNKNELSRTGLKVNSLEKMSADGANSLLSKQFENGNVAHKTLADNNCVPCSVLVEKLEGEHQKIVEPVKTLTRNPPRNGMYCAPKSRGRQDELASSDFHHQMNLPEWNSLNFELTTFKLMTNSTLYLKEEICHLCTKHEGNKLTCSGPCSRNFHRECLDVSETLDEKCWKCFECTNHCHKCLSCKSDIGDVRPCRNVKLCGHFFHLKCVQKLSGVSMKSDSFICPSHVCATCRFDQVSIASKGKMFKCLCCPVTYHANDICIAAGSQLIEGTCWMICSNHSSKALHGTSSSGHCNVTSCFLCAKGGYLLQCNLCPASYHASCLKVSAPPPGQWSCADCCAGRRSLYGEIVWCKMGLYRWWPGEICHPSYAPEEIFGKEHCVGEFPVRFLGTNDFYWTSHANVFRYQAGDQRSLFGVARNNQRGKYFRRALCDADVAFQIRDKALSVWKSRMNEVKPPFYRQVKSNVPYGNVQVHKTDVSKLTKCECSVSSPCNADATCLNRMLMYECHPGICPAGKKCQNQRFQQRLYPKVKPMPAKSGWGLNLLEDVKAGTFVHEYVGDLIDENECKIRINNAHRSNVSNFYLLTLDKNRIIDAGRRGNYCRFMNHSCSPNCEMQKWMVNGNLRVGLFAMRDIKAGAELTFNYNLDCLGNEKTLCRCGSSNCSGFLGVPPKQNEAICNIEESGDYSEKPNDSVEEIISPEPSENGCSRCGKGGIIIMCDRSRCSKGYHTDCLNLNNLGQSVRRSPCCNSTIFVDWMKRVTVEEKKDHIDSRLSLHEIAHERNDKELEYLDMCESGLAAVHIPCLERLECLNTFYDHRKRKIKEDRRPKKKMRGELLVDSVSDAKEEPSLIAQEAATSIESCPFVNAGEPCLVPVCLFCQNYRLGNGSYKLDFKKCLVKKLLHRKWNMSKIVETYGVSLTSLQRWCRECSLKDLSEESLDLSPAARQQIIYKSQKIGWKEVARRLDLPEDMNIMANTHQCAPKEHSTNLQIQEICEVSSNGNEKILKKLNDKSIVEVHQKSILQNGTKAMFSCKNSFTDSCVDKHQDHFEVQVNAKGNIQRKISNAEGNISDNNASCTNNVNFNDQFHPSNIKGAMCKLFHGPNTISNDLTTRRSVDFTSRGSTDLVKRRSADIARRSADLVSRKSIELVDLDTSTNRRNFRKQKMHFSLRNLEISASNLEDVEYNSLNENVSNSKCSAKKDVKHSKIECQDTDFLVPNKDASVTRSSRKKKEIVHNLIKTCDKCTSVRETKSKELVLNEKPKLFKSKLRNESVVIHDKVENEQIEVNLRKDIKQPLVLVTDVLMNMKKSLFKGTFTLKHDGNEINRDNGEHLSLACCVKNLEGFVPICSFHSGSTERMNYFEKNKVACGRQENSINSTSQDEGFAGDSDVNASRGQVLDKKNEDKHFNKSTAMKNLERNGKKNLVTTGEGSSEKTAKKNFRGAMSRSLKRTSDMSSLQINNAKNNSGKKWENLRKSLKRNVENTLEKADRNGIEKIDECSLKEIGENNTEGNSKKNLKNSGRNFERTKKKYLSKKSLENMHRKNLKNHYKAGLVGNNKESLRRNNKERLRGNNKESLVGNNKESLRESNRGNVRGNGKEHLEQAACKSNLKDSVYVSKLEEVNSKHRNDKKRKRDVRRHDNILKIKIVENFLLKRKFGNKGKSLSGMLLSHLVNNDHTCVQCVKGDARIKCAQIVLVDVCKKTGASNTAGRKTLVAPAHRNSDEFYQETRLESIVQPTIGESRKSQDVLGIISEIGNTSARNQVGRNQVDGNQVDGNQVDGNQVDGNQVDGNQVDGNQVDGNQVDGNQVDGNQVDGNQVDGNGVSNVDCNLSDKKLNENSYEIHEIASNLTTGIGGTGEGASTSNTKVKEGASTSNVKGREDASTSNVKVRVDASTSNVEVKEGASTSNLKVKEGASTSNLKVREDASTSNVNVREGASTSNVNVREGASTRNVKVREGASTSNVKVREAENKESFGMEKEYYKIKSDSNGEEDRTEVNPCLAKVNAENVGMKLAAAGNEDNDWEKLRGTNEVNRVAIVGDRGDEKVWKMTENPPRKNLMIENICEEVLQCLEDETLLCDDLNMSSASTD